MSKTSPKTTGTSHYQNKNIYKQHLLGFPPLQAIKRGNEHLRMRLRLMSSSGWEPTELKLVSIPCWTVTQEVHTTSEKQMQRSTISNLGIIQLVPYSGETFEGENFCKFHSFVAIRESFLHKIWGVASFGKAKASNLQKFSPQKSYFHKFTKAFFLESFPLYSMCR